MHGIPRSLYLTANSRGRGPFQSGSYVGIEYAHLIQKHMAFPTWFCRYRVAD